MVSSFILATLFATCFAQYSSDYDNGSQQTLRGDPSEFSGRYEEPRATSLNEFNTGGSFEGSNYFRNKDSPQFSAEHHGVKHDEPSHDHHHHHHDHGTSSMSFSQKVKHHDFGFKFEQKHGKHGHFHGYAHPHAYGGLKVEH